MSCKVCEAYKAQVEYLRTLVDRLMDEKHPDESPDPQEQTSIPDLSDPQDDLENTVKIGEG